MRLHLDQELAQALAHQFPRLNGVLEQLKFGPRVEIDALQLTAEERAFLIRTMNTYGPSQAEKARFLDAMNEVLSQVVKPLEPEDLETLVPEIVRYLSKPGGRGWLFNTQLASRPMPYVVTRLDYAPASNDEAGRVFLELKANAKGSIATHTLRIMASDVAGKHLGLILLEKGFIRESSALLHAYDETLARYLNWRGRYGEQFSGHGTGFYADDPSATHRNTDWSRKDIVILSSSGSEARLVNDESVLTTRSLTLDAPGDILGPYLRKAAKSSHYDSEDEVLRLQEQLPQGLFTQLPIHPYLFLYHLDLHHYLWVHADDLEPYAYRPELRERLVLPKEQTDLIDILTAEMDVLAEDIIAGKSGGTTVLCAGPPGVGKTLTAEVYAEMTRRPLYRVHSGQLGLNVGTLETSLKDILTRAQRWGAVLLIDEADVYIKRRDDDITMNAVVGVFLRVLEYFNGLLFLTTNRIDDIDEAIVSRCIALIKFLPPNNESRRRIWAVMSEQYGLGLSSSLIQALSENFPKASGRDIKGLAKLVSKYVSHKSVEANLEVFRRCAVFRGMDMGQIPGSDCPALSMTASPSRHNPTKASEANC